MFIVFQPRLLIPIKYSLSQFTMSLLYPLLPCLVSIFINYDLMPVIPTLVSKYFLSLFSSSVFLVSLCRMS